MMRAKILISIKKKYINIYFKFKDINITKEEKKNLKKEKLEKKMPFKK